MIGDKGLLASGSKADSEDDAGGSESDPSEDNMEEEEIAQILPMPPKKKPDPKKQLPIKR